jgi:hypothetical protein
MLTHLRVVDATRSEAAEAQRCPWLAMCANAPMYPDPDRIRIWRTFRHNITPQHHTSFIHRSPRRRARALGRAAPCSPGRRARELRAVHRGTVRANGHRATFKALRSTLVCSLTANTRKYSSYATCSRVSATSSTTPTLARRWRRTRRSLAAAVLRVARARPRLLCAAKGHCCGLPGSTTPPPPFPWCRRTRRSPGAAARRAAGSRHSPRQAGCTSG